MPFGNESVGDGDAEIAGQVIVAGPRKAEPVIADSAHFAAFNEIYARYFGDLSPARIFIHVPSWPGPFDVESTASHRQVPKNETCPPSDGPESALVHSPQRLRVLR